MASFIEKGRQNFAEIEDLDENLFDNIKKLRKIGKEVEDATKSEREAAGKVIKKTGEKIIKTGKEIREKGKRAETIANRAINIERIRANKPDADTSSTKKTPKKTVVKVNKNTPKDVKVNWKSTVPPKSKTPSTSSSGQKLLPGSNTPVTKPPVQGELPLGGEHAKPGAKPVPRGTSGGRPKGSRNTVKTSPGQQTTSATPKPVTPKPPTNRVPTVNPKLGSGKVRQSVKGPGSSTGQVTKGNLKFSGDTNYKSLLKKIDPPPTKPPVDPWFTKPTTSAKSFENLPLNPGKAGYHPGFKKSTVPVKPPVRKPIPADTGSLKDVSKVKKSFSDFSRNLKALKDPSFPIKGSKGPTTHADVVLPGEKPSSKPSSKPVTRTSGQTSGQSLFDKTKIRGSQGPKTQSGVLLPGEKPSYQAPSGYSQANKPKIGSEPVLSSKGRNLGKLSTNVKGATEVTTDFPKTRSSYKPVKPSTKASKNPWTVKPLKSIQGGELVTTSGGKPITQGGSPNNPLPGKINKVMNTAKKFRRLKTLGKWVAPVAGSLEAVDEYSRKKAQGKGNLEASLAGATRAAGGFIGSTLAAVPTAGLTKNPWATAAAGTAGWMAGADTATAAFDYGSDLVKGKKTFKDLRKDINKETKKYGKSIYHFGRQ